MSLYDYANGDPVNYLDPDGKAPQLIGVDSFGKPVYTGDLQYIHFPTPFLPTGHLSTRGQAVAMFGAGALELGGAIAGAVALSPSGFGSVPFVFAAGNAADTMGTAIYQFVSNESSRTLTSQFFDPITGNPQASDFIAMGIGAGFSFYTGGLGYQGITFRTGAEGNSYLIARAGAGAVPEAPIMTQLGLRRIDVLDGALAQESKVGFVNNTARADLQLAKDGEILANKLDGVSNYEWHLFRSKISGTIGIAPEQAALASRLGINVVQHGGSPMSFAAAIGGPTLYGLAANSEPSYASSVGVTLNSRGNPLGKKP